MPGYLVCIRSAGKHGVPELDVGTMWNRETFNYFRGIVHNLQHCILFLKTLRDFNTEKQKKTNAFFINF